MSRSDGRKPDQLREITFQKGIVHPSQLSVQVRWGQTIVQCGVSVEETVPRFMKGTRKGWLTAEYGMLPLSSDSRIMRDRDKLSGRTVEIQRLIGRCLRSMVDLSVVGERTLLVDCDVLSADGGTRTACITGASLVLQLMLKHMIRDDLVSPNALRFGVAAVSLGLLEGQVLMDLNYREDFKADVDINLIMNDQNELIEIQGCAEGRPFTPEQLHVITQMGAKGISEILKKQKSYLAEVGV